MRVVRGKVQVVRVRVVRVQVRAQVVQSMSEKTIHMSGSGVLQYVAPGQNGRGVCFERGEITNSKT